MHIAIASRLMAEKASALIKTPHAIISITDPDLDLPTFAPNENRLGILSLRFYDLEDITEQMKPKDAVEYLAQFGNGLFRDDQAAEIVAFVASGSQRQIRRVSVSGHRSSTWEQERSFLQSLIELGPYPGKRSWKREDLYER